MRFALLAIALLASGCRCHRAQPPPDAPPPPRPDDVLVEALVRDPSEAWGRVHALLGVASLSLPRTPFALLSAAIGLPEAVEPAIEPSLPLTVVTSDVAFALAWKARDPERLGTFAADRFALSAAEGGARWLRTKGGSGAARLPIGLHEGFFVAASSESFGAAHAPYLARALGTRTIESDARVEITARGMNVALVERAIDRLENAATALAAPDGDAPSSRDAAVASLRAFAASLRARAKAGRAVRIDLSIASDALKVKHRALDPEEPESALEVQGAVIRWFVRAQVAGALKGLSP